jgi:DNA-binding NtrC family response regulator
MAIALRVLLYGRDRTLVDLRAKVLQTSGFAAESTHVSKEVVELIRGSQFDLLILCQTLSDNECVEVLEVANIQPAMKRLVLTHGHRKLPPAMFDGECNPIEGPERLIEQSALLLNIAPEIPISARRARI